MMPLIKSDTETHMESFEDFFEGSLCGFVIADTEGNILRANAKIASWIDCTVHELTIKKFSDLLAVGGKIYYHTHLWPLLRMQGFFDEVVLELSSTSGNKLRVMVNAQECRDKEGKSSFIRFTILKATDRLLYEQNLKDAKKTAEKELVEQKGMVTLREQLIAVLGHDLRNPLSAVRMAVDLLEGSTDADKALLLASIKRSSVRMTELVNNIMDFARTRLGEGIVLNRKDISLTPVIEHVVNEMKLIYPKKEITSNITINKLVNCDADRVAQLLSNLLANALTHGDLNLPVRVEAMHDNGHIVMSVSNHGTPIPAELHDQLFSPFTRETDRSSQNGLGLGLYICSEIAKAHDGTLSFISSDKETSFTFNFSS